MSPHDMKQMFLLLSRRVYYAELIVTEPDDMRFIPTEQYAWTCVYIMCIAQHI